MSEATTLLSHTQQAWIKKQKVFFVSTAPLSAEGHINCSPKGLDSLRVLNEHTVAYQDFAGSGAETIAHLRENGRMVIMFCAFDGPPMILRLHGRGEVIYRTSPAFQEFANHFPPAGGVRAIIVLHISRVADSCGYAVPLMDFKAERRVLNDWVERKGPEAIDAYVLKNNAHSLDGLPAVDASKLKQPDP